MLENRRAPGRGRNAPGEAGRMLVCVQDYGPAGMCGAIVNGFLEEPVAFAGVGDLVLKIERICAALGIPGADREARLPGGMDGRSCRRFFGDMGIRLKEDGGPARLPEGAREVLTVQVVACRNFSLQGLVRGGITNVAYTGFRSALELMRILAMAEWKEGPEAQNRESRKPGARAKPAGSGKIRQTA